jgi:potassium-dependent mechanosensitive channel
MTASNLRKTTVAKSRSILPFLLVLLAACLPCHGQLEDLFKQVGGSAADGQKAAPDLRAQLEKWKSEAEGELQRLERYGEAEQLPEGVTNSDLTARRRSLEQTLQAISRHLIILDDAKEPAEALKAAKIESDSWQGFETPPPYSVLMVDELVERREAIEGKQASARSSVEVFNATLAGLLKESKTAGEDAEIALRALEQADGKAPAAQWKLDIVRARQRSLFIRASGLQHGIASLEEFMRANEVERGLLSRKIKEAGTNLAFAEEDLTRIKEASADRQKALRKEGTEVRKRQRKAVEEKAATAAALAKLRETPDADPAALAMAELNAETAAVTLEALQSISDSLDSYIQIESFVPEAYESRYALFGSKDAAERKAALENIAAMNRRLEAWEIVATNQLASVAADISKQQSRASVLPADDPKLEPLDRQRTILWERQALMQRAHQAITNQRRTTARWLADYGAAVSAPWYAPATETISRAWAAVQRVWNIPVNRYEETLEIDGQKVVQVRFVSLGTIIAAVLVFIIAYFIAARISRRIQRVLIHRNLIGEAQARTLRNWVMLLVAVLLALATLSWLSIPLTIFAFLAGALAIGVGFGTQTIIKNFISGIILLFERKVRVGDIIEVDGVNGVVSEINTRSSIVRSFNGIEHLIPNSLFLENRVVNWTLNSRLLRRELTVRVALGSPTQKIIEILGEAAERHGLILKEPAPFATLSHFADSSLDFTLYFWVELNDKTNGLMVDSDLRIMIEKRLADLNIHLGITRAPLAEIGKQRGEAASQSAAVRELP